MESLLMIFLAVLGVFIGFMITVPPLIFLALLYVKWLNTQFERLKVKHNLYP